MGKGVGSFFSVRRFCSGGSVLLNYFTKRPGLNDLVFRYMSARFSVPIKRFFIRTKSRFTFKLLKLKFKFEKKKFDFFSKKRFYKRPSHKFGDKQTIL
jgi:hypothetical protein